MIIKNEHYRLELTRNGTIKSLKNKNDKEFISYCSSRGLFDLYMLDQSKERVILNGKDFKSLVVKKTNKKCTLIFKHVAHLNITAEVTIAFDETSLTKWRIKVTNNSNLFLDKVDFPLVSVPNDLKANGGDSLLFTPMMEGAVVEDALIRNKMYLKYDRDTGYPAKGWSGSYPGATPMQFMAYYSELGGLYFASHDDSFIPKSIEFFGDEKEIKLEMETFADTETNVFEYEFDVVLGVFEGDWYDAAEIYRDFILNSGKVTLPKLKDNITLPAWYKDSPIVVCYPVRGEIDSSFEETREYYPYTKAFPYILELQKDLQTPLMPLLMHWEGTCPWAPPYVWPPYGDFENFKEYISNLHDSGNYFGVYCSGIAWTQQSYLVKTYNKEEDYEKLNIKDIVVKSPKQTIDVSYVCGGVGSRFDMCPSCEQTVKIATDELEKIVSNVDVDYVQFFDQVLGGGAYACYAEKHNHRFGPGRWQNEAMKHLTGEMKNVLKKYHKENDVLIGCEGNAAEPFINDFVFNDSRHNINYWFANPVPAYNYLFHEYVNNFMGNQNTCYGIIDFAQYPSNYYHRLAHSFVAGDFLTIVLRDKGQIHWDWCTPWKIDGLNQKTARAFIKTLSKWRREYAKEALQYGKMIKPIPYESGIYEEISIQGCKHHYPSVESCAYLLDSGERMQIFVNYLPKAQTITLVAPKNSCLFNSGKKEKEINGLSKIDIKPYEVLAIKY